MNTYNTMNQQSFIDMVSNGSPVVFSVVELMNGKHLLYCDFQHFYTECYYILQQKATPAEIAMFPKGAAALGRALRGVEADLKGFGITFRCEKKGGRK